MSVDRIKLDEHLFNKLRNRQKNFLVKSVACDDNTDKEFGWDSGNFEFLVEERDN